ncbi:MAG: carboxypeptidase-like regulatory domain-containing protein [Pyrinomonadaceae bacterium]
MNIVRTATAIALLALLALAASAQEKDKTTGALKGKVRVERGSPAGVAVILRRGDEEVRRVETDRKGEFTIARVPPGMYGLTIRKPGLAVASIEKLEIKAGSTRSLKDLILAVDEGSITFLRGSVFTEGGRSVPGVRVELSRVISESSVERLDARNTGETGEFVFRVPPDAAKYRLTLKADGAEPASRDVDVDAALVYRVALVYKPKP